MPPASDATVPASAPTAEQAAPCTSDTDCAAKAVALLDAGDRPGAQAMFQLGCDDGGPTSCDGLGTAVAADDPTRALKLWTTACSAGAAIACFHGAQHARESDPPTAASLYAKACAGTGEEHGEQGAPVPVACERGAAIAYGVAAFGAARSMAAAACNKTTTSGCGVLGVLYAKGEGVEADVGRSRTYLDRGCKGGDAEACANLKILDRAVASASVPEVLPVEGANVSIGSIGVDGLSATDLQCRREGGGGLFGGAMGAISGIAKRKGKLNQCARSPEDVRVRWTAGNGKIKTVDAKASSAKVEACVKKAVRGAKAAFGGTCAATFSIGG